MGKDKGAELEWRDIFRTFVVVLTDLKFVVKPALEFSTVLKRTGAIIREEPAAKGPGCKISIDCISLIMSATCIAICHWLLSSGSV